MKTKKQEELVTAYLSQFGDDISSIYHDIIMHLSELGYNPKKEKTSISFKHDLHNKQIAKMGTRVSKSKEISPMFALRFSACRGYSQRFTDIVSAAIIKYPSKAPGCVDGNCHYCAGEPTTHVYTCTFPDGETKSHCGAYALEIPDITTDDICEIKRLIKEEHEYLMKHEA
ncbi:MAG: hypothetical protein ACYC1M_12705 [Armatimonadota bacterium]